MGADMLDGGQNLTNDIKAAPNIDLYSKGSYSGSRRPYSESRGPFESRGPHFKSRGPSESREPYSESRGSYSESRGPYSESRGSYSESRGPYSEPRGSYSESRGPYSESGGPYSASEGPYSESQEEGRGGREERVPLSTGSSQLSSLAGSGGFLCEEVYGGRREEREEGGCGQEVGEVEKEVEEVMEGEVEKEVEEVMEGEEEKAVVEAGKRDMVEEEEEEDAAKELEAVVDEGEEEEEEEEEGGRELGWKCKRVSEMGGVIVNAKLGEREEEEEEGEEGSSEGMCGTGVSLEERDIKEGREEEEEEDGMDGEKAAEREEEASRGPEGYRSETLDFLLARHGGQTVQPVVQQTAPVQPVGHPVIQQPTPVQPVGHPMMQQPAPVQPVGHPVIQQPAPVQPAGYPVVQQPAPVQPVGQSKIKRSTGRTPKFSVPPPPRNEATYSGSKLVYNPRNPFDQLDQLNLDTSQSISSNETTAQTHPNYSPPPTRRRNPFDSSEDERILTPPTLPTSTLSHLHNPFVSSLSPPTGTGGTKSELPNHIPVPYHHQQNRNETERGFRADSLEWSLYAEQTLEEADLEVATLQVKENYYSPEVGY